jgi:hypothetical protein
MMNVGVCSVAVDMCLRRDTTSLAHAAVAFQGLLALLSPVCSVFGVGTTLPLIVVFSTRLVMLTRLLVKTSGLLSIEKRPKLSLITNSGVLAELLNISVAGWVAYLICHPTELGEQLLIRNMRELNPVWRKPCCLESFSE